MDKNEKYLKSIDKSLAEIAKELKRMNNANDAKAEIEKIREETQKRPNN